MTLALHPRTFAFTIVFGLTLLLTASATAQPAYTPVTKYDPLRNADQDIRDAIVEAKRSNRRVLLEVGGEWCSWCHILDNYFDAHPELVALRDQNYVTLKINFSEENQNKEVLSRYGPISGYPHIFVLESDGKLLHSQGTGVLESGRSYDLERFTTFLTTWAPVQKRRPAR